MNTKPVAPPAGIWSSWVMNMSTEMNTAERSEQTSDHRQSRLGIGLRLFVAFGAVALTAVIACAVGWLAFSKIEKSFTHVTADDVPAMTVALEISAESASLWAAAPALASAHSDAAREQQLTELTGRFENLLGQIETLKASTDDVEAVESIQGTVGNLTHSILDMSDLVEERLAAEQARDQAAQRVNEIQNEFHDITASLIDDANFDLVIGAEDSIGQSTEVINRLMDSGVGALRAILEVRAEGNLIAGILAEAVSVEEAAHLTTADERFEATTARLRGGLEVLPRGDGFDEVRSLSLLLMSFGNGGDSIFALKKRELSSGYLSEQEREALAEKHKKTRGKILSAHKKFLEAIEPIIDEVNFDLVIGGETAVEENAAQIKGLMDEGVTNLRTLLQLQSSANLVSGLLSVGANVPDISLIQPLRERIFAAFRVIDEGAGLLSESEQTVRLQELIAELKTLSEGEAGVFAFRAAELEARAEAFELLEDNRVSIGELGEIVHGLVEFARTDVEESTLNALATIEDGSTWLMAIAVGSLIAAGLIAWLYVGRNLVARLMRLAEAMRQIAGGDLHASIPEGGRDEISAMAKTLLVFRDGLAEVEDANRRTEDERRNAETARRESMIALADSLESSVQDVVRGVSNAASEMQTTSRSMSSTADQTNSQASAAAQAAEQANSNVQAVSAATDQLANSVAEIGRQVGETTRIADEAAAQARASNQQVEGLAESATKIGEVVSLIQDIAEQTNLLALNATIEAARAGDMGKGFAVVASEVKSLATQTARATEQIGEQISGIQSATGDSVKAIQAVAETIEQVNQIAATVSESVDQQRLATDEIARNVQEAAAGNAEVGTSIGQVAEAARTTGEAARQVLESTESLSSQSDSLNAAVDEFLKEVRAA